MSYARRTDSNSKEIVAALRGLGVQVFDMQRAAGTIPGFPDLLCVYRGEMYLIEVKTLRGAFTEDQFKFHTAWVGPPIYTMRSVVDAECWVSRMRTKAFNA
jgi:Holliday junction resolvase